MTLQRQSPDLTSCMSPTEFADDSRFTENDGMIGRSMSSDDIIKVSESRAQRYNMQADAMYDSHNITDDELEYKDIDENDDCVFLESDKSNTHYICLDRLPRPFISSSRSVCLSAASDVSNAHDHPLDLRHSKLCRRMSDVSDSDLGLQRKGCHRRVYTNSRERWRQQNVNGAFNDLRSLIPTYPPDKKLSKSEILRFAIKYIKLLTNVIEYQENESSTNYSDTSGGRRQNRKAVSGRPRPCELMDTDVLRAMSDGSRESFDDST